MSLKLCESDVVKQVKDLLLAYGWRPIRMQSGLSKIEGRHIRFGEQGIPDWLFLKYDRRGDRILWVETKATNGKLRASQKDWHEREVRRGATILVISEVNDLVEWLRVNG